MTQFADVFISYSREDKDEVLEEQAFALGYEIFRWMEHDPDLDPLRDHPRFIALIKGR